MLGTGLAPWGALAAMLVGAAAAFAAGAPLGAVGIGFAAAAAVAWAARRRGSVDERLDAIERLARAFERGELEDRLPGAWDGRLGDLADALNAAAEALEQRLGESLAERSRLEAVIGSMEEGVLAVDRDVRVVLANPRVRDLLGSPDDVTGRSMLEAVRIADVVDAVAGALERCEAGSGEVTLGPQPERIVRFHVAPFPQVGPTEGAVAVFRDVTELRRVEAVRRDFLANASHELKTPLAAVRGYAERLADAGAPDAASARAVEAILSNSKRLAALVEDLLELSRIESGVAPPRLEAVDAVELARRRLRDLDPRLRDAELSSCVEGEGPLYVHADVRALEQVLDNLLDNAVKYTAAGGSITLAVGTNADAGVGGDGGRVRLEVRDTGSGIPARDLPRLFERFYRVDPSRSRALGGTGLGLSIAKHLAQSMGGEIGVESQLGRGSCFWLDLPAAGAPTKP